MSFLRIMNPHARLLVYRSVGWFVCLSELPKKMREVTLPTLLLGVLVQIIAIIITNFSPLKEKKEIHMDA